MTKVWLLPRSSTLLFMRHLKYQKQTCTTFGNCKDFQLVFRFLQLVKVCLDQWQIHFQSYNFKKNDCHFPSWRAIGSEGCGKTERAILRIGYLKRGFWKVSQANMLGGRCPKTAGKVHKGLKHSSNQTPFALWTRLTAAKKAQNISPRGL